MAALTASEARGSTRAKRMETAALSVLLAAPVVDIDGTAFVQGGLFLLLMAVLWPVLFKPWLELQARRAEAIDGAIAKAKDLRRQADQLVVEHDTKLTAARDRANDLRADVRRKEEAAQAATLATARTEAAAQGEASRKRVAEQAETARAALSDRVEGLAQDIVARLLGRSA
jgi:F-type H+-transporting ATPase subunit b